MAGFVPGRDLHTLDAMNPEETQRRHDMESAEQRAKLDKEELAELERAQTGQPAPERKRSLVDRLLRRR